ncbi:MAG: acyl carrier protein [Phycisphaerales bacterium]|nr:MAG: acyl carrier protein [Phycisphaerales bacterium]
MTLHERLEEIFRTVLNDDQLSLSDDTSASDVEGWDSVAHINLMFSIESEFGIQFAGNELAEFKNVGELKRYLESRG